MSNKRIVQNHPCTREEVITKPNGTIFNPDYKGEIYGISFALWKIVDERFEKRPITYSLAGLRRILTGEVIYAYKNHSYESETAYADKTKLHRLGDASDIYNLCFRQYCKHADKRRPQFLSTLQSKIRRITERKVRRKYHKLWLRRFRNVREEEMQDLYGKPTENISDRQKRDFHHNNEL